MIKLISTRPWLGILTQYWKLVSALKKFKIRDNTIIFWTTDNGTSGNIIGQINGKKNWEKTYLTQNGVNEPFIVNWPGTISAGTKSKV